MAWSPALLRGLGGVLAAAGLVALDRGLGSADADRDLARLALLGLGYPDLEYSVLERGLHALGVDPLRQREGAREGPRCALDAVVALLALLVLGPTLTRDGEHVVLELDGDVVLGQPGKVGAQDEVVIGLDEVHRGHPAAHAATVARRDVEERVEQPIHLRLERVELARRLPTNQCHVDTS